MLEALLPDVLGLPFLYAKAAMLLAFGPLLLWQAAREARG